jgi:hypothetical protein
VDNLLSHVTQAQDEMVETLLSEELQLMLKKWLPLKGY